MSAPQLTQRLNDGDVLLGVAQTLPSPGILESMLCPGWDFVWIDGQHGQFDYHELLNSVRTADLMGIETIVRVPGHDYGTLGLHADMGPAAIMVPMVNSAAIARSVVSALRFPPLGSRSFGGRRPCDVFGKGYHQTHEPCILAQIETAEGLANAGDIAAEPGVGMLFFGPADMKLSMGLPLEAPVDETPELQDAMVRIAEAAAKAGKLAGCICQTPDALKAARALDYRLIAGGADVLFIRQGTADRLADLRQALEES
ncbi:MAG: hypothetical protein HN742_01130 [Lentisphaerae bacterium]|jgi:4-hydroxy-2-oxoheptanedioate aldolase|nr:hypothetical protein [Lentisphaerota bacterium]MBT4821234.1 hypothetical protein [Lentisphaerota bacterium]MBT5606113.1 hypothetical protein [Lentisphaerota bacterium]MBT7054020.1 hypothetical protein [Lentisphaerota bacterium]MBT7840436.1 hypothetical protein [Lentisphaerota bacterium]